MFSQLLQATKSKNDEPGAKSQQSMMSMLMSQPVQRDSNRHKMKTQQQKAKEQTYENDLEQLLLEEDSEKP